MKLDERLQSNDALAWEQLLRTEVRTGKMNLDDWLRAWLWYRLRWTSEWHSLFRSEPPLMEATLLGLKVVVQGGNVNKRRLLRLMVFDENPYHPDIELEAILGEHEWRFSSIGNPYLDDENYKVWEQLVLCKLMYELLETQKGFDLLMERLQRRLYQ